MATISNFKIPYFFYAKKFEISQRVLADDQLNVKTYIFK